MYLLINKKQFYLILFLMATIIAASFFINNETVATMSLPTSDKVVFIDPGHGGFDPGKVGVQGAHEKDINLQISLYLQSYLQNSGALVYMTRTTDEGLYNEDDSNKKRTDMRRRKETVNSSDAQVLISIHQNSFSQSKYKGGQVFYHKESEDGKRLAELIQQEFNTFVDSENHRKAKANNDYYVLRETDIPAVIVECGFLSNPQEEALLNTEEYQQKVAWAIYVAIIKYFSNESVS